MHLEKDFIKMHDELELFCQILDQGHDTWLVVVHGIGEHCERHNYMHELFKDKYNILQYDLRGHGKSTGERSKINSFRDFKTDLEEVVEYLKTQKKCKKYVLFGHSMGALIVAGFIQKYVHDDFYPEKIFLSAPPAGVAGPFGPVVNKLEKKIFEKLGSLPYSLRIPGLVDLGNLSHDKKVQEDYVSDPLNLKSLHSKLLFEMIKSGKSVFSQDLNLKCPGYCAVGTGDKIVDVQTLKNYFYEHEKKMELKIIPGAYHEMHNEIPKYRDAYFEYLKSSLS